MNYSANFIDSFNIQPFLVENNTKKPKHLQATKMAGVFSRFSIKIIYTKINSINYFACDLRTHVTA
jgi:hypothetical protein